jgi:hypothetical protein
MLKQDADQAWCDCSEAIRGMSLRVIPMSANSRSLNWDSSCMASPYRFQLWKKRMTGDNMGFVLSPASGRNHRGKYGGVPLHRNKIAAVQLIVQCMAQCLNLENGRQLLLLKSTESE